MSDVTMEDVVNAVGNLSVMDLIALTKELEAKWGVEAKPQIGSFSVVPTTDAPQTTQTEFSVVFTSFPATAKMTLVKLVREVLALGLLESKNFVESLPKTLKSELSKDDAEALRKQFADAGAIVEIQ